MRISRSSGRMLGHRSSRVLTMAAALIIVPVMIASCAGGGGSPTNEPHPAEGPQATAASAAERPGICLELTPSRERITLGEPILLVARLQDCSQEKLVLPYPFTIEHGALRAWLQPPGESRPRQLFPPVRKEGRGSRPRTLEPGAEVSTIIHLYVDRDGWTLSKPGRYAAYIEYDVGDESVTSEKVSFEVVEAKNAEDQQAAGLLMSGDAPAFLYFGGGHFAEAEQQLLQLVRKYPKSTLSSFARLALAQARADTGASGCEESIEQLRSLVDTVRDPAFGAIASATLHGCLVQTGRGAESERLFTEYFESQPGAARIPGLRNWLEARRESS